MQDLFLEVVAEEWSGEDSVWWCSACKVPRSVYTLEVMEDPTFGDPEALYWIIHDDRFREVYRSS
jgi:hypothetical protein